MRKVKGWRACTARHALDLRRRCRRRCHMWELRGLKTIDVAISGTLLRQMFPFQEKFLPIVAVYRVARSTSQIS